MVTGMILVLSGLTLSLFAFIQYKKNYARLGPIKDADLVSFYLELALALTPWPLRIMLAGLGITLLGMIILLIHLLLNLWKAW